MAKQRGKKPKAEYSPIIKKTPRIDPSMKDFMDCKPSWQVNSLDIDGPWGWKELSADFIVDEIIDKLKNFESMFWKEIIGRDNHPISVAIICPEAQRRLNQLCMDDIDELFSLRLSARQRIWGIRNHSIFKLLWWDSNHSVYLVEKKHT